MNDLCELKELTVLFADDDEIFLNSTQKTLEMLFKRVFTLRRDVSQYYYA